MNEVLSDFIGYEVQVQVKDGRLLSGTLEVAELDDYRLGDEEFDRQDAELLIDWSTEEEWMAKVIFNHGYRRRSCDCGWYIETPASPNTPGGFLHAQHLASVLKKYMICEEIE